MKKNSLVKFFAAALLSVFGLTSCQQNVSDETSKWDQKLENGFEYVLKYNPYDKTEKNSNYQFEIPLADLGVKQVPVMGDTVEISFNIKAKDKLNNFKVRVVSVNGDVDGWWKEIGSYEFCSGKTGEFPSTGLEAGSIYSTKLDLIITDSANSTNINDYRLVISSELRDIDKTDKTLVRKNTQNEYFIGGTDADGVSQSRYYLGDDYDGYLSLKGAIGLTHKVIGSKTKHLEAIPTRDGIKVIISLAADEELTYGWGNLYESKSGYNVDIQNNNNGSINLKETLTGPAKKVEILYPFTKENELYTFNLRGDFKINGVDSDIGNEKVRARATSTTQYDEIKCTSLLSKQVRVTESGSNPRFSYKINTTYTEADLISDLPFLSDTSKKEYVKITGQVLYGKTAWQNSEWLTGFETSNVPGDWAVNYDVFFTGANNDGFVTNYGSTFVDYGKRIKYKTYCASTTVRIKPTGCFEWVSGEIWSTENLFQDIPPENNAMRYFGNTQLPNYSNGEYWYAVRNVSGYDSGTAVVFYDQDKFIICQYKYEDDARHNISWTKGTYEKNGSKYTMTAKEDYGFIDSTYRHVGNLESVTWRSRSTPLILVPTPEILSNGKLSLSWNLIWEMEKQN